MSQLPAEIASLIEAYERGPELLKAAVRKFPANRLADPLPPGEWSVLQIVCHLSDFEVVFADRLKAVVAEDGPQLPVRDENRFSARLHYENRQISDELELIALIRRQVAQLLRSLNADDFRRVGIHSEAGPLTLQQLLARIGGHLPHHAEFIERKLQLLSKSA